MQVRVRSAGAAACSTSMPLSAFDESGAVRLSLWASVRWEDGGRAGGAKIQKEP